MSLDNWLNLSMLRLVVGVADHGGLSASARAANIAQSNASRSIRTMERRLGHALLRRSTWGSTLTQEGVLTVEWARDILDAVDRPFSRSSLAGYDQVAGYELRSSYRRSEQRGSHPRIC